MPKKIFAFLLIFILIISSVTACINNGKIDEKKYTKYQSDFSELFDTYTTFIAYAESEEEFNRYRDIIYNRMDSLNKLYDIYNDYEGISNLKTINDNAGIMPVTVEQDIIDLVLRGKTADAKTDGVVNIAMGPVLRLWHDARTTALDNPAMAYLPSMEQLKQASLNTDMDNVIVDEKSKTVFLKKSGMSLDVGALAKGYAAMLAVEDAEKGGLTSGILNAGGNVVTAGKPMDSTRQRWGVGIQDPGKDLGDAGNIIDTVFTNDMAVITSGNYQRFYMVDGKSYNHIIDPSTLMPAERFSGVTVLHPDSGIADMLSTALFILPKEQGEALLEEWNAEALWISYDGSIEATDGYKAISKTLGGYSAADK